MTLKVLLQEDIAGEVNRRFVKIFGNYRDASDRIKCEFSMPFRPPSSNSSSLADKNSEQYKDFKQAVWDIRHDEACPPISSFLEKGKVMWRGLIVSC